MAKPSIRETPCRCVRRKSPGRSSLAAQSHGSGWPGSFPIQPAIPFATSPDDAGASRARFQECPAATQSENRKSKLRLAVVSTQWSRAGVVVNGRDKMVSDPIGVKAIWHWRRPTVKRALSNHRFRRSRSFRPADYAGGVSGDQVVGRNVLAHHGSGSDDGAVANGHALEDDGPSADEDTATDDDWLGIVRRGIAPVPFTNGGVKIVVENQAPRSHKSSLPDVNPLSGAHGSAAQAYPATENNFGAGPQGVQRHRLGAGEGVAAEGAI